MGQARDAFRLQVAEALTSWRLDCIPPRPDPSFERTVFLAGLGEIIALRLRAAYAPLFQGLQRIENQLALLSAMREDPYAPPPKKKLGGRSYDWPRSTSTPRRSGP